MDPRTPQNVSSIGTADKFTASHVERERSPEFYSPSVSGSCAFARTPGACFQQRNTLPRGERERGARRQAFRIDTRVDVRGPSKLVQHTLHERVDRKSTRLNSSHLGISYAV